LQNNAKKKVAIVDDVSDVHTLYSRALEKQGHQVVFTAMSGEEIVDAVRNGTLPDVDVIIMDYRLPRMTGLDASIEVLKSRSNVKIIMATGDDGMIANLPKNVTISSFLVKPFSMTKLVDSVNQA
jgi:CheY-like chemotaxis protein